MPALYKAEGIILRTRPLGEFDKIITLLSPDIGRIHAVARGSRRLKSSFMGKLEPSTRIRGLVARGKNLDILTQVQVIEFFPHIRRDLKSLFASAYLLELFEAFTPFQENSASQYNLLRKGLAAIQRGVDPEIVCRGCEIKLIWVSGYQPELGHCVVCEGSVETSENFSSRLGGAVCDMCSIREKNMEHFTAGARSLYNRFLKAGSGSMTGESMERENMENLDEILSSYLAGIIGRPFSASRFMKEFGR
ncbi:MAG: DNA repair protein RecO [Chloroflexi bacterium]|nr:DNA repair protein RecO [Chloroflexota bacterium]